MTSGESWLERVAAEKVFREVEVSAQANKMLTRAKHNRIVLQGKQATGLVALRVMSARLAGHGIGMDKKEQGSVNPWGWLSEFADMIEDYQLTLGSPKNSRDMFLAALKREMQTDGKNERGFGK